MGATLMGWSGSSQAGSGQADDGGGRGQPRLLRLAANVRLERCWRVAAVHRRLGQRIRRSIVLFVRLGRPGPLVEEAIVAFDGGRRAPTIPVAKAHQSAVRGLGKATELHRPYPSRRGRERPQRHRQVDHRSRPARSARRPSGRVHQGLRRWIDRHCADLVRVARCRAFVRRTPVAWTPQPLLRRRGHQHPKVGLPALERRRGSLPLGRRSGVVQLGRERAVELLQAQLIGRVVGPR